MGNIAKVQSGLDHCPECNGHDVRIADTRVLNGNRWRRRRCNGCGFRWNTLEIPTALIETLKAFGPILTIQSSSKERKRSPTRLPMTAGGEAIDVSG